MYERRGWWAEETIDFQGEQNKHEAWQRWRNQHLYTKASFTGITSWRAQPSPRLYEDDLIDPYDRRNALAMLYAFPNILYRDHRLRIRRFR